MAGLIASSFPHFLCHKQHTERAKRLDTQRACPGSGGPFVNQEQFCIQFSSKYNGFAFARVKFLSEDLHRQ